jgi:hypothetical protein
MFLTHDVTNEGNRGRPSHPKEREVRVERILNEREQELGTVTLEAKGSSVVLVAEVGGKVQTITFPAKRPTKAKKTVAARKARNKK